MSGTQCNAAGLDSQTGNRRCVEPRRKHSFLQGLELADSCSGIWLNQFCFDPVSSKFNRKLESIDSEKCLGKGLVLKGRCIEDVLKVWTIRIFEGISGHNQTSLKNHPPVGI